MAGDSLFTLMMVCAESIDPAGCHETPCTGTGRISVLKDHAESLSHGGSIDCCPGLNDGACRAPRQDSDDNPRPERWRSPASG